jgi:isoquinoline 1-oxidoreductase beta subunit
MLCERGDGGRREGASVSIPAARILAGMVGARAQRACVMTFSARLSRRTFLVSAAAAGGGLSLGFGIPSLTARAASAAGEVSAWIVIQPDETVIIRVARSEMGQGVLTALPMLVAEELECDWAKVRPEFVAPRENLMRKRVWGSMSTGASWSIAGSQEILRQAGATARAMLVQAAAAQWNVAPEECRAANGIIIHAATGRTVSFGQVAEAAARLPPPVTVALKEPKNWTLIGRPRQRFDVPDKVSGKAVFGADVRLPGMLYAAIAQCPTFRGTLQSVDATAVTARAGIRNVVRFSDAVAVVADSWWQANEALKELRVAWSDDENANVSSADISAWLRDGLSAQDADVGREDGDVATALAGAAKRVEADYAVPFLAHATMEPQTCTARFTADGLEVWAPTQDCEGALTTAAVTAGLRPERVVVHRTAVGGGFGRRLAMQDFVQQAVFIAKEAGRSVQLAWSREEDIQHDFYRPVAMARIIGGLDAAGTPLAWHIRISGQSIIGSVAPEMAAGNFDLQFLEGLLEDMPYGVPNYRVDYAMRNSHVPVGPWRGVHHTQNAFFKESFIDEMALAAQSDPYLFRRKLLQHRPRQLAVLDAAAEKSQWGAPLPEGLFRGIALHEANATVCAQVVEASVSDDTVRVHRVVSAIDPGHVVDPRMVAMQTESAIAYALTAALYGEISLAEGRVEQSNFHDYRLLRMSEMPQVDTVIVPSGDGWGGCGEPAVAPLAPALCNALFAGTGRRIRALPLKNYRWR